MLRTKINRIIKQRHDRWYPVVTYWFQHSGIIRTRRDKKMLMIVSVFLLFLGYYVLIWSPLSERIKQQNTELQQLILMNVKLLDVAPAIVSGRHQAKQPAVSSPLRASQVITDSAVDKSVIVKRIAQREAQIQVWTEPVTFSDLLNWLKVLEKQHALPVAQIDISSGEVPGTVIVQRLEFTDSAWMSRK